MVRLALAALAMAAAAAAQPRVRVTEPAGLARTAEPVTVKIGEKEETVFVTIGPHETRTAALSELRAPSALKVRQTEFAGFTVENEIFRADHSAREVNGEIEDSGTLRGLDYKPAGVTLKRTQNRMHWAPSFQRTGARGYTSIAMWSPVQKVTRGGGEGWFTHRREGNHRLYPEIKLQAEYRYYAGVPYFLFHAVTTIASPIDMFWLRGQEMTMDDLFTHVAFPGGPGGEPRVLTFEERKPVLEKNPLPPDVPWIAFLNLDKGYGFGAVTLGYQATTTAGAHTSVNDGAANGKYWDRHLVSRTSTRLKPGDRYEERTAYALFRTSRERPVEDFLFWERRLRQPVVVTVLP